MSIGPKSESQRGDNTEMQMLHTCASCSCDPTPTKLWVPIFKFLPAEHRITTWSSIILCEPISIEAPASATIRTCGLRTQHAPILTFPCTTTSGARMVLRVAHEHDKHTNSRANDQCRKRIAQRLELITYDLSMTDILGVDFVNEASCHFPQSRSEWFRIQNQQQKYLLHPSKVTPCNKSVSMVCRLNEVSGLCPVVHFETASRSPHLT